MTGFSKEMQDALRADAEKLSAMTGEEHTVEFFDIEPPAEAEAVAWRVMAEPNYEHGPDFQTPNEARIAELENTVAEMLAALKAAEALAFCGMAADCYSRREIEELCRGTIGTFRAALAKADQS